MIDAIVEFVLARLADDEAAARAAMEGMGIQTGEPWSGVWSTGGSCQSGLIEDSAGGVVVYDEGLPSAGQAAHIARHDPARVLREVEWKRDILRRYVALRGYAARPYDKESSAKRRQLLLNALELALEAMAHGWRDHQDFRPEWAEWLAPETPDVDR